MKRFLMITPQQPTGNLKKNVYEPVGNSRLTYGETSFPIIPTIAAYAEAGETVSLVTLTYDYEHCKNNLIALKNEIDSLSQTSGITVEVESILVPFDDSTEAALNSFSKLIEHIEESDDLYACLTFGSKPMPLVMMLVLRYATSVIPNTCLECVVYGQIDRSQTEPKAKIYDVTALVQLDEIINLLAMQKTPEPASVIKRLLEL